MIKKYKFSIMEVIVDVWNDWLNLICKTSA